MPRIKKHKKASAGAESAGTSRYTWLRFETYNTLTPRLRGILNTLRRTPVGVATQRIGVGSMCQFFLLVYEHSKAGTPRKEVEDAFVEFCESDGEKIPPLVAKICKNPATLFPPCPNCGRKVEDVRFVKELDGQRIFYCSPECFLKQNGGELSPPPTPRRRRQREEAQPNRGPDAPEGEETQEESEDMPENGHSEPGKEPVDTLLSGKDDTLRVEEAQRTIAEATERSVAKIKEAGERAAKQIEATSEAALDELLPKIRRAAELAQQLRDTPTPAHEAPETISARIEEAATRPQEVVSASTERPKPATETLAKGEVPASSSDTEKAEEPAAEPEEANQTTEPPPPTNKKQFPNDPRGIAAWMRQRGH